MDFTIWWKFYLLTVSTFKYLIQLLYFFYEKYVLMYNLFFVKMKLHCVQFEHQNRSYFALSSFQFLILDAYDINQEDRNGQTPLMLAVILGEEEIIRLLVRAGKYYVIYFDRSDVMRNP